jgi:pyridoxal phosphate enzyme (YggS family)
VAISKRKSVSDILEAYNAGHRIFGENKVQELVEKVDQLPEDIEWHMVGHLQTNKVKYIAPFVDLIHSVDSFKLLKEISKQGRKHNRIIPCLLQVHIAQEETKFGLSENEVAELIAIVVHSDITHIKIVGLMGMATYTTDEEIIRSEFRQLRKIFDSISMKFRHDLIDMKELSIGMSGDYKIAMGEGSTMIRIGTGVFGARN